MNLSNMEHVPSLELGTLLHILAFLMVAAHCLRLPREPRSTLLWLFVTGLFPIVGPLTYLAFGINHVPRRGWHKLRSDVRFGSTRSQTEQEEQPLAYWRALRAGCCPPLAPDSAEAAVNTILDRVAHDHPLLGGNAVEVIADGGLALDAMFKAIAAARHHIHVQSYIIGRDAVGRALLDRLADQARTGIQVRVLFDQYGSRAAYLTGLFRRYSRVPNMRCVGFTQANLIKRQFQLNLRNHRKNLIIDGRVGFLGGVNFHDVYLPGSRREAIHDYHFRVCGPAVLELQYTFLRDWFYMCDEDARALLVPGHFPQSEAAGKTPLRLLNASPNAIEQPLVDALFTLLGTARHQVLVVTPYLVLSEDLRRAFRAAALRGVAVKVLLPAVNNHPSVDWAARASYDELLLSGVRLFLRRPPFIHAKALVVDGRIALIGSANLDARSLRLSYETTLVAFDPEFAARLKQTLLDDFARADEITLAAWRARPRYAHYLENFFNLMSPAL
ncbi:MAG: hypothetical protein FJ222_00935 [Lentisphaerae bacterium]|nr:hypothetical protein [Lentisphaerota bacterium]